VQKIVKGVYPDLLSEKLGPLRTNPFEVFDRCTQKITHRVKIKRKKAVNRLPIPTE
jgi:hypothetical protein